MRCPSPVMSAGRTGRSFLITACCGGGRHVVMSAETLYRMTFDGPLPERSSGAPHSVDVDERRLEAAQRLAERLRHENDDLRARFAAFGIDI